MVRLLDTLLPVEKKLQSRMAAAAAIPEPPAPPPPPPPAGGPLLGGDMVGVGMEFPISAFDSVEDWADGVVHCLTDEHQDVCRKVAAKEKAGVHGCSRCHKQGCSDCSFWRAVRYWRNIECAGKFCEAYEPHQIPAAKLQAATYVKGLESKCSSKKK